MTSRSRASGRVVNVVVVDIQASASEVFPPLFFERETETRRSNSDIRNHSATFHTVSTTGLEEGRVGGGGCGGLCDDKDDAAAAVASAAEAASPPLPLSTIAIELFC